MFQQITISNIYNKWDECEDKQTIEECNYLVKTIPEKIKSIKMKLNKYNDDIDKNFNDAEKNLIILKDNVINNIVREMTDCFDE